MAWRTARALLRLVVLATAMAPPVSAQAGGGHEGAFERACVAGGTMVLDFAMDARYPTQLSGVSVSDGRRVVLAGGRSATVVVLDSNAAVLLTVGGVGDGPGELRFASHATRTASGEVLVVDPMREQVVTFDARGRFTRAVRTPGHPGRATAVLADSLVAVGGFYQRGRASQLTALYSVRGGLLRAAVPIPVQALRLDRPAVDATFLVPLGRTRVAVASAVAPEVWVVEVRGEPRRIQWALPGSEWRQLEPPARPLRTLGEMRQWYEAASTVRGIGSLTDEVVALGVSGGGEPRGNHRVVLVNVRTGGAMMLTGAPGILRGARDGWLLLQRDETDSANVLQWYRCLVPPGLGR